MSIFFSGHQTVPPSQQFYELVTPGPAAITLEEAKRYLKEGCAEDDLIREMTLAVTEVAEKYTGRDMRTNGWRLTIDCFSDPIKIRRQPVVSVETVTYNQQTTPTTVTPVVIPATTYFLQPRQQDALIWLETGQEWPDDVVELPAQIVIEFTTKAAACLTLAKTGMLRHLAYLWENRGDCATADFDTVVRSGASTLYDRIRIARL